MRARVNLRHRLVLHPPDIIVVHVGTVEILLILSTRYYIVCSLLAPIRIFRLLSVSADHANHDNLVSLRH